MYRKMRGQYPKKKGEGPTQYKGRLSDITGGIWYGYSQDTRKSLIKRYD